MFGWKRKLENYIKFSWNSTMTCKHQLQEGKRSHERPKKENKLENQVWCGWRERKTLTCYKTWITHDHESANTPCRLAEVKSSILILTFHFPTSYDTFLNRPSSLWKSIVSQTLSPMYQPNCGVQDLTWFTLLFAKIITCTHLHSFHMMRSI